ncbi:unnamed protein product [Arabis nemorensis]|uniref:Uncharacterized protein n=1 Tax=Arabis nemorensis TaxID=586526 RepID=A0A565B5P4_9BRAS|nr:unnamed protein product [Arabis nemorensis]
MEGDYEPQRHIAMIMKCGDKQSFPYMPLGLSFLSFIDAAIWTAYSLIYQIDIYILICNGFGTLAYASQFIVNAMGQGVQVHQMTLEI